jgi:two-component system cell cycle sensor histidine kinase/response regulator CckA
MRPDAAAPYAGRFDYDDIQQIRASSNRAASLTRQLLAFSRQQTLRLEVLQLPDVSEISQMLRRLIGEKISLVVTHDRDLGAVRADPTQLEQVIVNLAVNARDAIQDHARKVGGDGRASDADHAAGSGGRCARDAQRDPAGGGLYGADREDTGGAFQPTSSARSGSRSSPLRSRARVLALVFQRFTAS